MYRIVLGDFRPADQWKTKAYAYIRICVVVGSLEVGERGVL
jgi:hypothetical protein